MLHYIIFVTTKRDGLCQKEKSFALTWNRTTDLHRIAHLPYQLIYSGFIQDDQVT